MTVSTLPRAKRRSGLILLCATVWLGGGATATAQTPPAAGPAESETPTDIGSVRATTPLSPTPAPGTANNVVTSDDIERTGIPSLTGTLNDDVPSVHINDASGNPFQPSLMFRGFLASPVEGDEQGLAVYVNGARFNQPLGDTVNWDLIPSNAIQSVDVEGGNAVFGLNALGGSVSVKLKNGFTYHGGELVAYGGSNGRAAGMLQYGIESDNTSAYVAVNAIRDDGFRNTSASTLYQLYTDLGWRGHDAEVHLGIMAASTDLGNPGATPVQLLAVDRTANSTAPNTVYNKYVALNLNGTHDISDSTSAQWVLYYSNLSQRLNNGVTVDAVPCTDGSGNLCTPEGDPLTDTKGRPIPDFLHGGPYGGTSYQGVDSNAYGASGQISNTHDVFGLPNHVVGGMSFDAGDVMFNGSQTIGVLTQGRFVVPPEITIDQADLSIAPVRLATTNRYYGAFFTDLLDVTPKLTLSVSGRFNVADITLRDQLGTSLNGSHSYDRFNPGFGASYKVLPNVSLYASYSESNRAPTPSELSCSNALQPCQLPNFFISDPNLKQVVGRTTEFGARGHVADLYGGDLTWNADLFRTDLGDDIIYEASPLVSGAAYYQNAGTTRRQGAEAKLVFRRGPLRAILSYSYVQATFQSPLTLNSPLNPHADANGLIHVTPGDKMPGIPANQLKFVTEYDITDRWTVGAAGQLVDGQYLYGDEANQNKMMAGYFVLNLNTSYRITDNIQLFALANNVLNHKYSLYGTFAQVDGVPFPEVPGGVTDTRVESPAAPFAAYGGVRVTF